MYCDSKHGSRSRQGFTSHFPTPPPRPTTQKVQELHAMTCGSAVLVCDTIVNAAPSVQNHAEVIRASTASDKGTASALPQRYNGCTARPGAFPADRGPLTFSLSLHLPPPPAPPPQRSQVFSASHPVRSLLLSPDELVSCIVCCILDRFRREP